MVQNSLYPLKMPLPRSSSGLLTMLMHRGQRKKSDYLIVQAQGRVSTREGEGELSRGRIEEISAEDEDSGSDSGWKTNSEDSDPSL